jgi:hypothetical protein
MQLDVPVVPGHEMLSLGIAALAAIAAPLTALIGTRFWQQLQVKRRHRDVIEGIRSLQRVYTIMLEMQAIGASRVVLFAGHNSGGLPRPGAGFWSSAVHWVAQPYSDTTRFEHYNNVPVDAEYVRLLLEAHQVGYVHVVTERMPPCVLRSYYEAEGVTEAVVVNIGVTEKKLLYLTAAKYDGHFTPAQVTQIVLKARPISVEILGT